MITLIRYSKQLVYRDDGGKLIIERDGEVHLPAVVDPVNPTKDTD